MTRLSDIPDEKKCKAIILDSLMKENFITKKAPQSTSQSENPAENIKNFILKNKKAILTGTLMVTGLFTGPAMVGGVVGAIGFGEAGIVAGSIAAWMMSLHRGTVAAGSLVAILQSVGAAGLGIGGIIASGLGCSFFAGAIAKALLNILESEELLDKLNSFVTITATDECIIFDMKQRVYANDKVLASFLKGFDSAQRITQTKKFKFLINLNDEGSNSLLNNYFWWVNKVINLIFFKKWLNNIRKNLEGAYRGHNISAVEGGYILDLN